MRQYDTIIVDEAHERSLNIDFLLGFLKQLLSKRPDLKLIITSATIDPDSFARHFADADGKPAPIIEVSGRTYPVEVLPSVIHRACRLSFWRGREQEIDPLDGLVSACRELANEGSGDILCFFSGEREIRDAADALESEFNSAARRVDILPLFGRLSNAEQHRVFNPVPPPNCIGDQYRRNFPHRPRHSLRRRYWSRTNFSVLTPDKVQRLPVEEISQASAKQRSGRCGRTADGVAIRLYSKENFEAARSSPIQKSFALTWRALFWPWPP